jgi:hypothetical protein
MTTTCATVVGIVLQLLGAGYLVWQAWCTSRKLAKFSSITYDTLGATIDTLAHEIGSQFTQQLIGFVFVLLGSALQLYAALAA